MKALFVILSLAATSLADNISNQSPIIYRGPEGTAPANGSNRVIIVPAPPASTNRVLTNGPASVLDTNWSRGGMTNPLIPPAPQPVNH